MSHESDMYGLPDPARMEADSLRGQIARLQAALDAARSDEAQVERLKERLTKAGVCAEDNTRWRLSAERRAAEAEVEVMRGTHLLLAAKGRAEAAEADVKEMWARALEAEDSLRELLEIWDTPNTKHEYGVQARIAKAREIVNKHGGAK